MKPGRASRTAEFVCAGRAIADHRGGRFRDPTALALLPAGTRDALTRYFNGAPPRGWRERFARTFLPRRADAMAVRSWAIDEATRQAPTPQLVILGAGLDGRAWRMGELADTIVFEVDHPDSQRDKRARVGGLTQRAQEVRFVPVDFTRDRLDDALANAGHDAARPTMWIWEGVVMYLTPAEIEATLDVVARRSAKGSRLAVLYHHPALALHLLGFLVKRLGEPLKSTFTVAEMRALLERYGFSTTRDRNMPELGADYSAEMGRALRMAGHMRLAVADRHS